MEKVIVLDEETRGVGEEKMSGGRRMGCSSGKGSYLSHLSLDAFLKVLSE